MQTNHFDKLNIFFDPMQIPKVSWLFVDSEMVLFIGKIKGLVIVKPEKIF
jgi:hypothetical protein